MKISGVYQIICLLNGKIYIGSSKDVHYRWKKHRQYLNKNRHKNPYLQRAWNLHGEDNFKFEITEETSVNTLIGREQFWLDNKQSYNPVIGFNLCKKAYSTLGKPPSQKCIDIISKKWIIIDPQGNEFLIKNLTKFCRENKVSRETLKNIALGIGVSHKGWKCRPDIPIDEWNKIREKRMLDNGHFKKWRVIDPSGNEFIIINLKKFCRENNLVDTNMHRVAKGLCGYHKGWQCSYA